MKPILAAAIASWLMAQTAFAGECKIKVLREPCPGKEAEVLKPYDNKREVEEKKDLPDEAACLAWAEKSARQVRKGQFANKKATANFAGKDLGKTFEDKKDCK